MLAVGMALLFAFVSGAANDDGYGPAISVPREVVKTVAPLDRKSVV